MATVYVAMDEGCYECGEPSVLLGVFMTKEEADTITEKASEWQNANWRGQHSFPIYEFELDDIGKELVGKDYYEKVR